MNERVCSALNPEVLPKYRRSLATASTQTEIASASSGVLERVVIIVGAENAPVANVWPEWRGAERVKIQTEPSIPRPLQAVSWLFWISCLCRSGPRRLWRITGRDEITGLSIQEDLDVIISIVAAE